MQILSQNPRLVPNFSGRKHSRENVDALINASDYELQQRAYRKTVNSIDSEHHRKLSNALFYSIPLVAGAAAFLLSKGKTQFFGKLLSGTAGKLADGVKVGARWGAAVGTVGLLDLFGKKLRKESESVSNFENNNPLLTFAAKVAGAIGIFYLGAKGARNLGRGLRAIGASAEQTFIKGKFSKGTKRIADVINPKFINNIQNKTAKAADKINGSPKIAKIVDGVRKFFGKAPAPIKNIGKTVLAWSPVAVLFGGMFHDIDHQSVKNREFANNYNKLKTKQENVTRARMNEISDNYTALSMLHKEQVEENVQLAIQNKILETELEFREQNT